MLGAKELCVALNSIYSVGMFEQIDMVKLVQQAREKFSNLEVADTQNYMVQRMGKYT